MNRFLSSKSMSVGGISLPRIITTQRFYASVAKEESAEGDLDIAVLEKQANLPETGLGLTDEEIEQKRNKSRLFDGDRNVVHDVAPRIEVVQRFHTTVKYKRKIFGRYGMEACDAPLGIAWPTKEQVEDAKDYESTAYPQTLQEMWTTIAERKRQEAETIRAREEAVANNILKLDKWIGDLNAKVAKKEAEALAARERKERLMEEVRRHFGFQISPKDERFKEMLAQKDKEEKKRKKAAKKQARDEKMLSMFAEKSEALKKRTAVATGGNESGESSKTPAEGS